MKDEQVLKVLTEWLKNNLPTNVILIVTDYIQSGDVLLKTAQGEVFILSMTEIDEHEIDDIVE